MSPLWLKNWERITPFLRFPAEIRRVIYTTNTIESLNSMLRKITRSRGHFPSDEAATKLLYLVLRNAEKHWTLPIHHWQQALNQFVIHFGDRVPV